MCEIKSHDNIKEIVETQVITAMQEQGNSFFKID